MAILEFSTQSEVPAPLNSELREIVLQPISSSHVARASQFTKEIKPEILAVIAAAVAAFLGREWSIRSVKVVEEPSTVAAWARQGRVMVQKSHNITQKER